MNLNKVFVGHTKNDGCERTFYKRIRSLADGTGYTVYIDLETNEVFNNVDVDTDSLLSFKDLFSINQKRMIRRKIVNVYQADRDTLIDTKGAFYGNVLMKYYEDSAHKNLVEEEVENNILFARIADPECRVLRLENSDLYYKSERVDNGCAVEVVRSINRDKFNDVMKPKRLLLEMNYRKEL